ncbi:MAG: ferric reductase like transmembrane component-domain-containing protein [Benjaminiella poitrasii]|nr:MAG: ferric reductase like transmembrane component-domain-containing protein [Benjaminiella poitrasii]
MFPLDLYKLILLVSFFQQQCQMIVYFARFFIIRLNYFRSWTNFWMLGMAYAFFLWSLFVTYCLSYQINRVRIYFFRRKRLLSNDNDDNYDLIPGTTNLFHRLDCVVRIPFITEMIPLKHIIATTLFSVVNLYFVLFVCPYEPAPYNIAIMDRRATFTGMVDLSIVFFFAQRNSFLPKISGLTYEELLPFHRIIARIGFLNFVPHLVYRVWYAYQENHSIYEGFFKDKDYTTGTIATAGYVVMFLTSFEYIRRNHFEIFYYSHIIFLILAVVYTCLHFPSCLAFYVPAMVLWVADRAMRTYQSWIAKTKIVKIEQVAPPTETQEGIVRILFESKILKNFRPGQYVFAAMVMNGRKLWEYANWHPFTISETFQVNETKDDESSSTQVLDESSKLLLSRHPSYESLAKDTDSVSTAAIRYRRRYYDTFKNKRVMASIYIKALGTKTRDLLDATGKKTITEKDLKVFVDGLYGPQLQYQDFSVLALFATGIGVAPAMAIIQDVVERRARGIRTVATNHIHLIWAIRYTDEIDPFITMYTHWVKQIETAILPVHLFVSVFITRMESGYHNIEEFEQFKVVYGKRPDVSVEMMNIKKTYPPSQQVWAHVCGSTSFTRTVINEAVHHKYEVHQEVFEF